MVGLSGPKSSVFSLTTKPQSRQNSSPLVESFVKEFSPHFGHLVHPVLVSGGRETSSCHSAYNAREIFQAVCTNVNELNDVAYFYSRLYTDENRWPGRI